MAFVDVEYGMGGGTPSSAEYLGFFSESANVYKQITIPAGKTYKALVFDCPDVRTNTFKFRVNGTELTSSNILVQSATNERELYANAGVVIIYGLSITSNDTVEAWNSGGSGVKDDVYGIT